MKSKVRGFMLECFRLVSKIIPEFAVRVRLKAKYEHEKKFFSQYFSDFTKTDDFEDKLNILLLGLDKDSVDKIQAMVERFRLYFDEGRTTNYDLFTPIELKELLELQKNFHNKTEKLSNNLYRYGDYLFPIRNFEPSVLYHKHGIDFVESRYLNSLSDKSIVDVGGFIGDSVVVLSELNPKNIITFEAIPHNYELLKKTIKLNKIDNVIPINNALGSKKGRITMTISEAMSTKAEMDDRNSVEVDMITLDDYVNEHGVEVGLIKVDIEGAETDFLKGAVQTIVEQKPVILLSIYHNTHDFLELKTFIESLNVGYKFSIYKGIDGAIMLETLLICQV